MSVVALTGLALGLAAFLASVAAVGLLLVLLPSTYFLDRLPRAWWGERHPIFRWAALVLKNVLGAVLILLGALMLFTPGQGVLTILIGVMLLDLPGMRTLERKLVSRPLVLATVNRLRARFGKAPLVLEVGTNRAAPLASGDGKQIPA